MSRPRIPKDTGPVSSINYATAFHQARAVYYAKRDSLATDGELLNELLSILHISDED